MKISCQNCSSKYTVSDEKVQGKTVKLKCKKCGATILVNAAGATTVASGAAVADHPSSPAEAPSTDGTSYLVNVAEGDQRTMTIPELVAAYQSQVVTADTYVWADGMTDWLPLGQVDAIVAALNAGTAAMPAAMPMAAAPMAAAPMAAMPAAASSAESAASAASLAASARPAARREPAKRADVFGNEKTDDVATSAPLFSASAKAAASSAAAAAKSAPREENSVLFSLSALTSKPGAAAPAAAPSRKDSREDSGLIDLKALAASAAPSPTAASASAAAIMGGDDAGLFPLGVPAASQPAAPPVAANVTIPPPASKAPMFIGIGALVAALAIVGVFFAMQSGDEKPVTETPPQPTVTAPAAQPTPTETVAAAPTAEPTATATATASATAVAAAPKGGGKYVPKGGTGSTSKAGTSSGGSAPASTPAKPKSSGCGCAPGDLMCAMKCSAK